MRKLTINRIKSSIGCLTKMKVYIEDPINKEIVISNTPCRKLGKIKNGELKTFIIDESPLKVFVIADKMSKNYCNDFYEIPEGEQDVFLFGKCKYNPIVGNAFVFKNNPSNAAAKNRKKAVKKRLPIFIAAILTGL